MHFIDKSFTRCLIILVHLHKKVIDKDLLSIIYDKVPECRNNDEKD